MVIMTTIINEDKDWFKNQVKEGIEGFIDCEREYLTELLMKYVYEQIFLSGCIISSSGGVVSEAFLIINIPLPDSKRCVDFVEDLKQVSIMTNL